MRFIGLDLAWSARNPSGGVVLAWDGKKAFPVTWDPALTGDEEVGAFVRDGMDAEGALVAVDAPLVVPNERGTRAGDRALTAAYRRHEAGTYPANRARLGPVVRGEALLGRLQALGFTHGPRIVRRTPVRHVVEVYPHAAAVELFGLSRTLKYKARPGRSVEFRWAELERLRELLGSLAWRTPSLVARDLLDGVRIRGARGRALKAAEDLLDALLCAYIALHLWHWGEEGYRTFGDRESGYILVPTARGRPAARG
ncbi:MAG: DUF429 domain-containing protein [Candidatus Bipolaricaulota bacterium]|nr:DUF429 domain-containing protein [Candidatus Bipolaricaulota bacterium]